MDAREQHAHAHAHANAHAHAQAHEPGQQRGVASPAPSPRRTDSRQALVCTTETQLGFQADSRGATYRVRPGAEPKPQTHGTQRNHMQPTQTCVSLLRARSPRCWRLRAGIRTRVRGRGAVGNCSRLKVRRLASCLAAAKHLPIATAIHFSHAPAPSLSHKCAETSFR